VAVEVPVPPLSRRRAVAGAAALSWLGLFVHNLADLPARTLVGAETLAPTAVYLALLAGLASPARRGAARLLLGWAWLHLIGGAVLSILPLPVWPYQPEQSLRHYAFHALYGAAQLPLLIAGRRHLRTGTAGRAAHPRLRRVPDDTSRGGAT
jgi:hypothetical protein